MKIAKKYKDWNGPFKKLEFENKKLNRNSIIWFPALCPSSLQEPFTCDHEPISKMEYDKLAIKPQNQIFYKEKNINFLVQRIVFWTALISLLGATISLLKDCNNKPEKSTIIICNDCVFKFDIEDQFGEGNGKKAKFRIAYLTQEKRWKYDDEKKLTDSTLLSENLKENLPKFPNINESLGLIAVGVASQEGNLQKEEDRADLRADEILFNLRTNELIKNKELYKLNLGQFSKKVENLNVNETAYQRRVIIISILEKDLDMNIGDLKLALKDALISSEGLNYKIENYSLFDFTKQN